MKYCYAEMNDKVVGPITLSPLHLVTRSSLQKETYVRH
jgi:hypothetical protein